MDYYLEYYNSVESVFCNFINSVKVYNCEAFIVNGYSIEQCIISALSSYAQSADWKNIYNNSRISGIPTDHLEEQFLKELINKYGFDEKIFKNQKNNTSIKKNDTEKNLPYQNKLVIYIYNQRLFVYLLPLIKAINQKVILLSDSDIVYNEFIDNVTVVKIRMLSKKVVTNEYLETIFPAVYHYVNTLEQYINYLKPKGVIFLEGNHFQDKIINTIAKYYSIPTICIQQGWPSFMHYEFKNLSYDYYLTWGDYFNKLWEKINPSQNHVSTGYLYEIEKCNSKNRITFFLQAPVFLSDNTYFDILLDLIEETAKTYPSYIIQVREHPEYKIDNKRIYKFSEYNNIVNVSNMPLKCVFKDTLIAISHFSSSLMEGVVHGCIPLVFDPTSNSQYYPDVESLGIGLISKDKNEFFTKLDCILSPFLMLRYTSCIADKKHELFKATSIHAINNTVNAIVSIVEGDIR